jgi:hypothetical protein
MVAIGATRVIANQLDVAAQGDHRQHVFSLPPAEAGDLRPESNRKTFDTDAQIFRDQKMSQLMDHNEQTERDRDFEDDFCHLHTFHTRLPVDYRGPGNTGGAITSTPGGT